MEDVLASLRQFYDPTVGVIDHPGTFSDQLTGRIGLIEFNATTDFYGHIVILLRKKGGRITKANLDAFWNHWGYEPVEYAKEEGGPLKKTVAIVIEKDRVGEMIKATPKGASRRPYAEVKCDHCEFSENFRADYERVAPDRFEVKEGQVLMKATQKGWSNIKGSLRCPECEAKRRDTAKPQKEITVKNVVNLPITEEPRQPSREQKRQIVTLLTDVYDIASNRYTGGETDKTVADAIGGGVLFGWVAQIREDLFGPDGGNEEIVRLEADVKAHADAIDALTRDMDACSKLISDGQKTLAAIRANQSELQRRVDALKTSVGPRARNV